jgi:hypothetical protein
MDDMTLTSLDDVNDASSGGLHAGSRRQKFRCNPDAYDVFSADQGLASTPCLRSVNFSLIL